MRVSTFFPIWTAVPTPGGDVRAPERFVLFLTSNAFGNSPVPGGDLLLSEKWGQTADFRCLTRRRRKRNKRGRVCNPDR